MRKGAFLLLWLFVFTLPFASLVRIPGVGTLGRGLGLVAFGLGFASILYLGYRSRFTGFYSLFFLFLLWSAMTFWWSANPQGTINRLNTYVQLGFMVWLIGELAQEEERRTQLMQAYVLGIFVTVMVLMQGLLGGKGAMTGKSLLNPTVTYTRFTAFGFDANWTAFTIALALPMVWYLLLKQQRSPLFWLNMAILPLAMFAIMLTGSRTGVVCMAMGLCMIPLTVKMLAPKTRTLLYVAVLGGLLAIPVVVPKGALDRLILKTQEDLDTGLSGDKVTRFWIWQKGLETFADHPLTGVGLGAYRAGTYGVRDTGDEDSEAIEVGGATAGPTKGQVGGPAYSPHNSFISVLVEEGLIGIGLFCSLLIALLYYTFLMQPLEQRLYFTLLAVCVLGFMFLAQEYKKHTWFIFGLLITHASTVMYRRPRRAVVQPWPLLLERA